MFFKIELEKNIKILKFFHLGLLGVINSQKMPDLPPNILEFHKKLTNSKYIKWNIRWRMFLKLELEKNIKILKFFHLDLLGVINSQKMPDLPLFNFKNS